MYLVSTYKTELIQVLKWNLNSLKCPIIYSSSNKRSVTTSSPIVSMEGKTLAQQQKEKSYKLHFVKGLEPKRNWRCSVLRSSLGYPCPKRLPAIEQKNKRAKNPKGKNPKVPTNKKNLTSAYNLPSYNTIPLFYLLFCVGRKKQNVV